MEGINRAAAEIVVAKEPGASNAMRICGDADIACCERIQLEFNSNHNLGNCWIFDLRATTFLDSEAIKVILEAIYAVRLGGGNAAIVSRKGSISWRTLNLLGISGAVCILDSPEEAKDSLRNSS